MNKSNKHPRKTRRYNLSAFYNNKNYHNGVMPIQHFMYIKVKRNSVKWYYDYLAL